MRVSFYSNASQQILCRHLPQVPCHFCLFRIYRPEGDRCGTGVITAG